MTDKPKRVYWKSVKRVVHVPFCPRCDNEVEMPQDAGFRTVATYRCRHCGYLE